MKNLTTTSKTAQFTTATLGVVRHPSNLLVEFLEVWKRRSKVKACILSWLDSWHISKGETGWICASYQQIGKAFGYCRDTIGRHLKDLIKDGYIRRRNLLPHEKRYPTDTRKMYQINFPKLREKVDNEILTPSYDKSDGYPLKYQTVDVENQTDLNSYSNLSKSSLTHQEKAPLEKCVCVRGLEIFSERGESPEKEVFLETQEFSNNQELSNRQELLEKPEVLESEEVSECEKFTTHPEIGESENFSTNQEISEDFQPTTPPQNSSHAELITKLNQSIRPPFKPIQLGSVEWVMRRYPENITGAIKAVKQGLKQGWMKNPTGYLIRALKEGIKVEQNISGAMSRDYWWTWVGENWGKEKRNSLIERVSDLGQGLSVYFTNGLERPFDEIKQLSLEEVEALALETPETYPDEHPQDPISPQQVEYLQAIMRGIGS
ncbi:hypothetical protein VB834_15270 [Limnoraphis robusta Tam1]|uniref:Uncharacterized protein n=1 Tax=Limnoraphis robusta CCNP1315 TaxID=3110306 RepID=A0ABU5U377_9CYAN|nr:hypothetical protein [Limnoraphis robusta]MEA5498361.1 hypothetical protein [Limnoraphis robusta BA-68 BA1]MEA5521609.1 hypothetical protein [Limnoraphis robusta CCNP1315]MEA5540385.1 hypothetical protein [Limnoraphis robusta Tam1]MEA5545207.1 hypothetical protein [Limnoraphis robusta CCNP1324]